MTSILSSLSFETPLGTMIAIGDEKGICLLEFTDSKHIQRKINNLTLQRGSITKEKETIPLLSIQHEICCYFQGKLKVFATPLCLKGTPFQQQVWQELLRIPYGCTTSYRNQACLLGNPLAYRAVANANAMNHIAIAIPCHRVINENQQIGGYGGGVLRKEWLLNHEKQFPRAS